MKRRVHPKSSGAIDYLLRQIAAILRFAPRSVANGDPKSTHQARVATRRLKAILEIAAPLLKSQRDADRLARFGKRLRRSLGRLRDLDVLSDLLQADRKASAGALWLHESCRAERAEALTKARSKLSKASIKRELAGADRLVKGLSTLSAPLSLAVREAAHLRLDTFAAKATDRSADLHELRIAGKSLRYTLEIAQADGATIDAKLLESFKQLQDDLGHWHDRAVLAGRAAEAIAEHELSVRHPDHARDLARLIDAELARAGRDIDGFHKRWAKQSDRIARAIRKAMPLSKAVG
jgi:CHAD domain-containing protein